MVIENECLKKELQQKMIEFEILWVIFNVNGGGLFGRNSVLLVVIGFMLYNLIDFYFNVFQNYVNKILSYRIVISDSGECFFVVGVMWELIISYDFFWCGLVDIGVVSEWIKFLVKCDG